MKIALQIAEWADRLRDISAFGLLYAETIYERQRYESVQDLAIEMMAYATQEPVSDFKALKASVLAHPTPFATGDAAIIDVNGKILLIQRSDTQNWAMPGGALEVGETPAEGVIREAYEETGLRCSAQSMVGVFDSRLCGSVSRHHMYQFVFLCQPLEGKHQDSASHANEVIGSAWFEENQLPKEIEAGHDLRIAEAYRMWHGKKRFVFRPLGIGAKQHRTVTALCPTQE